MNGHMADYLRFRNEEDNFWELVAEIKANSTESQRIAWAEQHPPALCGLDERDAEDSDHEEQCSF